MKFLSLIFLAFLGSFVSSVAQKHISVDIPIVSTPVLVDGKRTFVYELQLFNHSRSFPCIDKLEILNAVTGEGFIEYDTKSVATRLSKVEAKGDSSTGLSRFLYVEMILPENGPPDYQQRITYAPCGAPEETMTTSTILEVPHKLPVSLADPLRGGHWAAVYEPSWERGHRRVIFHVDGKSRIPGRFAIDFIKMDDAGKMANGDEDSIKNWYGYGAEVLAVADGIVASAHDDVTESPTISGHANHPTPISMGNYISIRTNGRYVFYEHLQPGSIRVKKGQQVKKGRVIARLGFTGHSTGPHLHLHVADKDSPLGAEGLPFTFDQFELIGRYDDMSAFGKSKWRDVPEKQVRLKERPAPNSVINFKQ